MWETIFIEYGIFFLKVVTFLLAEPTEKVSSYSDSYKK